MEPPPHPMRLGDDEKDYYRLGAAGVVAGPRAPGMAGPGGPAGPAVFAGAEGAAPVPGAAEVYPTRDYAGHNTGPGERR